MRSGKIAWVARVRGSGVALICALTATSCSEAPEESATGASSVILVVMDTVRADHLPCYGYARPTTPNLCGFAERADRYENAFASAPWTLPSHASMFTGRLPFEHGAHLVFTDVRGENGRPFDGRFPTLAETLREAGYATGAFVANAGYLGPNWGLSRGFDTYVAKRARAGEVSKAALGWLDERGDAPFFLFLNYMDAHPPYNATPRPGVVGRTVPSNSRTLLERGRGRVLPGRVDASPLLVRELTDQYDTGIANLDAGLAPLLEWAERRRDNVVTIVTSDHGEYLGEHRLIAHPRDVYQVGIHVPLIVAAPGRPTGRVIEEPIALHQLPALIASQLASLPGPLAARFPEERTDLLLVSELYYDRARILTDSRYGARFARIRRAFVTWPHKLIHSSDAAHEVYDLANDPGETTDLYRANPDRWSALVRGAESALGAALVPPSDTRVAPELSDEERQQLRDLGYAD